MLAVSEQLDPYQLEVADSIVQSSAHRQSLAGLAGTGKTTAARHVYDRWVEQGLHVIVMAPSGKAASVLRAKGVPATTIHHVIYHYRGKFKDDRDETQLIFKDHGFSGGADRYVVDETSMVTWQQMVDIESRGVPTLWVGDPGQLPPVKSRPTKLLSKPTHLLRTIHRQAADNPIIKWAYSLRRGAPLTQPFPGINRVDCSGRGPTFVAWEMKDRRVDRLVVKTNAQRVAVNTAYRGVTNRRGIVDVGDEIICVLNNKLLGVVNGETFRVLDVRQSQSLWTEILVRSHDTQSEDIVRVWNGQFGHIGQVEDEGIGPNYMLADYAYGITCHKMQGSSARHIGIAAKGYCGDNDRPWNYTAATRAEEEVTVFA